MSIDAFIPQVWHRKLMENLNDRHVYGKCATTEYEGEIKAAGDTVKVFTVARPTISNYTKNSTSLTYETLNIAEVPITVDTSKSFSFKIDDIDRVQTLPGVMDDATREASWGFADEIDVDLATALQAGVAVSSPDNRLQSGTDLTVGTGSSDYDAYDLLVDLSIKLDKQNTPKSGRWVVVPPDFIGLLLKDPRFSSFGTERNLNRAERGNPDLMEFVSNMVGMTVYISNNVPLSGSTYTIIAGYKGAFAFVEQIPEGQPEAIRLEGSFADGLRGLILYGYKVLRPSNLASVDVIFSETA